MPTNTVTLEINDIPIEDFAITQLEIYTSVFSVVPRIKIRMYDSSFLTVRKDLSTLMAKVNIYDNIEDPYITDLEFEILTFEKVFNTDVAAQQTEIEMTGVIRTNEFFNKPGYSYEYGTATEVLQKLLETNVTSGKVISDLPEDEKQKSKEDEQLWGASSSPFNFFKRVLLHTYRENDKIFSYIDVFNQGHIKSMRETFEAQTTKNFISGREYDSQLAQAEETASDVPDNIVPIGSVLYNYSHKLRKYTTTTNLNEFDITRLFGEYINADIESFPSLTDKKPDFSSRSGGTQKVLTDNHYKNYHQAYINNVGLVNSLLDNFISLSVPMTRVNLMDLISLDLDSEVLNNKQLAGKYFIGNIIYSYSTGSPVTMSIGLYRDGLNTINPEE